MSDRISSLSRAIKAFEKKKSLIMSDMAMKVISRKSMIKPLEEEMEAAQNSLSVAEIMLKSLLERKEKIIEQLKSIRK